jgi:Ca2+-binding EF-hand superfamily protein
MKKEGFNADECFKLMCGNNQIITIDSFLEYFTN